MVEEAPGDEAGLRSITFIIRGKNAYGMLESERGVHRLVRISPFDNQGRRQTSFAEVDVVPESDEGDAEDVEIKPEDLRFETFKASGAGGQYVNKTESAIRVYHLRPASWWPRSRSARRPRTATWCWASCAPS